MSEEPVFKLSPELLRITRDFNREMAEATDRASEACKPLNEALAEGIRRAAEIVNQSRNRD